MGTVKVSKKGWVIIPRDIRKQYQIHPGDLVQVVDYAGHIAIVPALKDPILQARGLLKGEPSLTDALLQERRQEREREERQVQPTTAQARG
ncbi:MAG: transcriptional regulator, AbrB family [Dehalococcoidia bacterium]|nr:transcriptional regulator, AbrB family [Dehalococcoidia bacterium]